MEAVGLGTLKSKINALSHKVKVVIEHGVVVCTSPCLHYLFIYCYTKHFRRNMFGTDFASSVGDQTLFGTDFSKGCCAARRVLRVVPAKCILLTWLSTLTVTIAFGLNSLSTVY